VAIALGVLTVREEPLRDREVETPRLYLPKYSDFQGRPLGVRSARKPPTASIASRAAEWGELGRYLRAVVGPFARFGDERTIGEVIDEVVIPCALKQAAASSSPPAPDVADKEGQSPTSSGRTVGHPDGTERVTIAAVCPNMPMPSGFAGVVRLRAGSKIVGCLTERSVRSFEYLLDADRRRRFSRSMRRQRNDHR
jgi:hypothetical protein